MTLRLALQILQNTPFPFTSKQLLASKHSKNYFEKQTEHSNVMKKNGRKNTFLWSTEKQIRMDDEMEQEKVQF